MLNKSGAKSYQMDMCTGSILKKLVRRLISAVLEPTAASALSPANLPTTIISAALNNN